MPTANPLNTTPTHHAPMRIGGALAGGPAAATTPIAALNRRIYDMAKKRHELDCAWLATPQGPMKEAAYAAFEATLDPVFELYDEIRDLPAQTMEDAAVQATIALYYADRLDGSTLDEEQVKDVASDLLTLLSSVILALVKAGGLDIDRLGWGELRNLCALHAPDGSDAA